MVVLNYVMELTRKDKQQKFTTFTDGTRIWVNRTAGLRRIEQNRDNFFLDRLNGGLFEVNSFLGLMEKGLFVLS